MSSFNPLSMHKPKFLSILGSQGFEYNKKNDSAIMKFDISPDLTHSNGTIVQGGFITAMLDTSMAHLIILKSEGKLNSLSLNINVNFISPGSPGEFNAVSRITKMGNKIAFAEADLFQNNKLIASATSTNKLAPFK